MSMKTFNIQHSTFNIWRLWFFVFAIFPLPSSLFFAWAQPTNPPVTKLVSVTVGTNSALVGYGTNLFSANINLARAAGIIAPTNARVNGYIPVATGDQTRWQVLPPQTNILVGNVTDAGTMAYSNAPAFLTLVSNIANAAGSATDTNAIANLNGFGTNTTLWSPTLNSPLWTPGVAVWTNTALVVGNDNTLAFLGNRMSVLGDNNSLNSPRESFVVGSGNAFSNQAWSVVLGSGNNMTMDVGYEPDHNYVLGSENTFLKESGFFDTYRWRFVAGQGNTIQGGQAFSMLMGQSNVVHEANAAHVFGVGNYVSNLIHGVIFGEANTVTDVEVNGHVYMFGLRNRSESTGFRLTPSFSIGYPGFIYGRDNTNSGSVDGSVNMGVSNYNSGAGAFTLGHNVTATHDGAFVFGDKQNTRLSSTRTNRMLLRFQNGIGVNTNDTHGMAINVHGGVNATALYVNGVPVNTGGTSGFSTNFLQEESALDHTGSLGVYSEDFQIPPLTAPGDMFKVYASGVTSGSGTYSNIITFAGNSFTDIVLPAGGYWTLRATFFKETSAYGTSADVDAEIQFRVLQSGTNYYNETRYSKGSSSALNAVGNIAFAFQSGTTGAHFKNLVIRVDWYP